MSQDNEKTLPSQHQDRQPGIESEMDPSPASFAQGYSGSDRLVGKVALVTGGDSGIGRAVAIAFAKEGADVAIVNLDETDNARQAAQAIENCERRALSLRADVGDEAECRRVVAQTVDRLGRLDILVNNAAEQHPLESIEKLEAAQLERTFRTNIFSMFYIVKAALGHLEEDARIINTHSVTAYRGSPHLLDYSATKGAIVAFTRLLAVALGERGIRVNAVAPGPIWTPLIPSTFSESDVESFGASTLFKRPGQPDEVVHSFVFLAAEGASYMTGQVLHPNGGHAADHG